MHRARICDPRLHPAHRLRPFFISSLLMSNIMQRDLPLALISSTYHLDPPASKPSPRSWRDLRSMHPADHASHANAQWDELRVWDPGD